MEEQVLILEKCLNDGHLMDKLCDLNSVLVCIFDALDTSF